MFLLELTTWSAALDFAKNVNVTVKSQTQADLSLFKFMTGNLQWPLPTERWCVRP